MIARLTLIVMLSVAVAAQSGQTTVPAKSSATYPIAGTTVSSLTGQPVADAHVTVMSVEHNEFVKNVISGVDGHFAFSGLPAGNTRWSRAHTGFARKVSISMATSSPESSSAPALTPAT